MDSTRNSLGPALSLGLHAAVVVMLISVTALPGGQALPEAVSIELVPAPAPAPVEAAPQPEPPEAKPQPQPLPAPAPAPAAKPRPPMARPMAKVPPAPVESGAAPAAEPTAAAVLAVLAAPAVPSPPAPGTADDALMEYGRTVWVRIAAHKPRGVRLPGVVTVTFAIAPDGGLTSAEITGSGGGSVLGQLAVDTVRLAAPFPPPPPRISAARLVFSIPFHAR